MSEKVEQLLNQVKTIDDAYKIVKKNTGEDFNLFQILGMETAEVKTHSKFLAELLNPKGSHLQGNIFLKIFIDYLNNVKINHENNDVFFLNEDLMNLNLEKSTIQIEKYIGIKTPNTGGRIDITVEDSDGSLICIENKIYAGEQENQLLRYYNYGIKFKKCHLLFLTLDGKETATLNIKDGKAYPISYKKHIVEWLELCKKEAVNLPILRETIGQYINLIKKLTNQTTNIKMGKDIQKLITNNLNEAKLIKENYDETVRILMLEQLHILKSVFIKMGFAEDEVSTERALRGCDGLFVLVKFFGDDNIDLGINIEMANDYYYFTVAQHNHSRNHKDNHSEKFSLIRNYLHSRISDLTLITNYTIGKSNDFKIGLDRASYYFPSIDNTNLYEELVLKILELKKVLND